MKAFVPTRTPTPLPGTQTLALDVQSELQVVERLREGLSTQSVEQFAEHLGLPIALVLKFTDLKSSTFYDHKKRQQPLSPEASGRVYRLAKVVETAEAYFEDSEEAHRWLTHAKVALGGETPLTFARSAEGADYVVKLLGRMAHGVIS